MKARRTSVLALCLLVCSAAAGGCVDFITAGVTQGLTSGISESIAALAGLFLGAWAGGA